jgi:signal transduction histidine kinase
LNAADPNSKLPAEWWRRVRHDLRSAIAPMRMATQLLRGGRVDEGERDEALQVIDRQLEQLLATVEDIGDLLQVQAGRTLLQPASQDANLVLDVVCGRGALVRELAARKLQLHCEACAHELPVAHDPARLVALLEYLLMRMAAHSSPGGELKLSLQPDGNGVLRLSGAKPSLAQDPELLYLQGIDGGQGEPGQRAMLLRQQLQASGMDMRVDAVGKVELHFPPQA